MRPIDWLLLVLRQPDDTSPASLDPIRIQKALFLVSREEAVPASDKYEFEPYNYGPYSRQIYVDLDRLVLEGVVDSVSSADRRWSSYELADDGRRRVAELVLEIDQNWLKLVADIRNLVTSLSFKALLRKIYSEYPDYAVKSIANL